MTARSRPSPQPDQFGDYRAQTLLAAQHDHTTWLGEQAGAGWPKTTVVIKHWHGHPLLTPAAQQRFLEEMQARKLWTHPHCLPLLAAGLTAQQTPYVVSAYAPNRSLADHLLRRAPLPLPVPETLRVLKQIGEALHAAHQQGLWHGRLTPHNVLFDAHGNALLADFALWSLPSSQPPASAPLSAEQKQAADQYALACLAYEMGSGLPPFASLPEPLEATNGELAAFEMVELADGKLIRPGALNPLLPAFVETALLKALADAPADRFADVAQFVQAITRYARFTDTHEEGIPFFVTTNVIPAEHASVQDARKAVTADTEVEIESDAGTEQKARKGQREEYVEEQGETAGETAYLEKTGEPPGEEGQKHVSDPDSMLPVPLSSSRALARAALSPGSPGEHALSLPVETIEIVLPGPHRRRHVGWTVARLLKAGLALLLLLSSLGFLLLDGPPQQTLGAASAHRSPATSTTTAASTGTTWPTPTDTTNGTVPDTPQAQATPALFPADSADTQADAQQQAGQQGRGPAANLLTPSVTASPTAVVPTAHATSTTSASPSPSATGAVTPSPTVIPSPTATASVTPTETQTQTVTPAVTPTVTPTSVPPDCSASQGTQISAQGTTRATRGTTSATGAPAAPATMTPTVTPAATATPATPPLSGDPNDPGASPAAIVDWTADFETGDLCQWAGVHTGGHWGNSAIQLVQAPQPVRQGKYAAQLTVATASGESGENERAELSATQEQTGGYPGQDWYYSWSLYLPSIPNQATGWGAWTDLTQWMDLRHNCSPPLQIALIPDPTPHLALVNIINQQQAGTCQESVHQEYALGPLVYDQWIDLTVHIKFSADAGVGFAEVWLNGRHVLPLTHMATLDPGSSGVYLEQALYRPHRDGTSLLYLDATRRYHLRS